MRLLIKILITVVLVIPTVHGQEIELTTAEVQYRSVRHEMILDGVVEAVSRATVTAQTTGRIVEVNFDVDDYVAKNDVIVRMDDTEQKARLDQARANLREAEANRLDAKSAFDRVKALLKKNTISKADYDRADAELKAARARVQAAKARLAEAEEQLSYTVVRAPFSGIVTERHVEPGEISRVGRPLMTGLSLEKLRVNVDVPQTFIGAVRQHRSARVLLHNGLDHAVQATQLTIFPYADPATHTFRVRTQLPEALPGVNPGMFVKVAFVIDTAERLVVPEQAVAYRSEVSAVYVVDREGRIAMRQVRVGRHYDGQVEILAGLEGGERVALDTVKAAIQLKQQQEADS